MLRDRVIHDTDKICIIRISIIFQIETQEELLTGIDLSALEEEEAKDNCFKIVLL
jgi:hypothetical protein